MCSTTATVTAIVAPFLDLASTLGLDAGGACNLRRSQSAAYQDLAAIAGHSAPATSAACMAYDPAIGQVVRSVGRTSMGWFSAIPGYENDRPSR